ncbi:MAG TPA: hypothetical protein VH700_05525 [Gemmatimonadales bacterium]|jgi:hypothetical protein
MTRSHFRSTAILLTVLAFAACGDDETAPEEGHTPDDAALFVNGTDVSDGLVLPAGEVVRVEVRFIHEGEVVTGIEDEHHAGLTFTPATLATVASVADHNFQKDVTGQGEPGAGTVMVGYGHDEAADELSFGPFDVTVVAPEAGTAPRSAGSR